MEHKTSTPVASPPADAIEPSSPNVSSVTPVSETTATISTNPSPADDPVPTAPVEAQLPRYEEHDKEVMPAPAPAVTSNTTASFPAEKTPWDPSTQAPTAQPGQGLVINRAAELTQLNEEPRLINCPFCKREAMTRVTKESTGSTGMAALCCCLFGGLCCAFIPYCMEMCHDCHHFCTNCGQQVATRPHDGQTQVFSPQSPVVMAPGRVQPPQAAVTSHGNSGKN